ncbi:hypothetical protein [Natronomonas gomsonensis]|uniref:hypothetical protein n=1 Tax=Natronomonas gomsonensis TaxID=1046043 RepID=UPI0015BA81F9|nr:hypothetical protein [Natronomonas gomsonensis]
MRDNPWQEVLETLYEMGGRGEFPRHGDGPQLDPEVNLVEQTGLSEEAIATASKTLVSMGLAERTALILGDDDDPTRNELELTGKGYSYARERRQEQRSLRSNRAVTRLTLVLAFVGVAQAMALTVQVSNPIYRLVPGIMTVLAGVLLVGFYTQLYRAGVLNSNDWDE